jgi:energy-coupling factor transporter ATP-binding protein EcfA2
MTRGVLGDASARLIDDVLDAPTRSRLLRLRDAARPPLDIYRAYSPAGATLEKWRREARIARNAIGRRLPLSGPISRTVPRGGVIVAIIGSDGSGKTTIAHALQGWLGSKLDARVVYFGSGVGPASLARWPMKAVLDLLHATGLRRPGGKIASGTSAQDDSPRFSLLERFARVPWALVLAEEKRATLRRVWRARNRGIVLVCDRYPQHQVMGFNDGPLLSHWLDARSSLRRRLARREAEPYAWAEANGPDVVVKLHVSLDVAQRRRPDMQPDELLRRQRVIDRLEYPPGTRVVDVNADRSWNQVLLDVKREVWRML